MIKVITSLPGCYVLPYLDHTTFTNNQLALKNDPDYPLNAYPSKDAVTGAAVDPFTTHRYPANTGFDYSELTHALQTYQLIASGAPAAYAGKFYNIRGVQSPSGSTTGSISWGTLTGPVPSASPVGNGPGNPGDDTQPAWSARLATLGANQVKVVKGNVDHMFIMEEDDTHAEIASVL